jgi:hypothetical protein
MYSSSNYFVLAKGPNDSSPALSKDGEELDQVVGNTEDEIGDLIASVREDEMMFSPDSLLATFGPMIAHICLNPAMFKVQQPSVDLCSLTEFPDSIKFLGQVPLFHSAS